MCGVGCAKHVATHAPTMMKKKMANESHMDTMMNTCIMRRQLSYCTDMRLFVVVLLHRMGEKGVGPSQPKSFIFGSSGGKPDAASPFSIVPRPTFDMIRFPFKLHNVLFSDPLGGNRTLRVHFR